MYNNLSHIISDAVLKCLKIDKHCLKMAHFSWVAHVFHLETEILMDNYLKVDLLISSMGEKILKAPSKFNVLKEMYPGIPLPPKQILIR